MSVGLSGLGRGASLRGSDIVVDKELDEERSVADVHQQAKEVEGGVRVAEPHVVHHKESAKEHLGDLERSDECPQPVRESDIGGKGVVSVHDAVDQQVHDGKPRAIVQAVVHRLRAEDHGSDVMVPVQQGRRATTANEEHGVQKFWDLGKTENGCPWIGVLRNRVAKIIRQTCASDLCQGGLGHKVETKHRKDSKEQVPEKQCRSNPSRFTLVPGGCIFEFGIGIPLALLVAKPPASKGTILMSQVLRHLEDEYDIKDAQGIDGAVHPCGENRFRGWVPVVAQDVLKTV